MVKSHVIVFALCNERPDQLLRVPAQPTTAMDGGGDIYANPHSILEKPQAAERRPPLGRL
jgi:hypothetical protein